MSRPRDTQRAKFYKVDAELAKTEKELSRLPDIPYVLTQEELETFGGKIVDSRWFRARFRQMLLENDCPPLTPRVYVQTPQTRGTCVGWLNYYTGSIALTHPMGRRQRIHVIHGLAHVIATYEEAWHGRDFARKYLELTKRFLGHDQYQYALQYYRLNKIRRREPMGEDARLAASVRYARRQLESTLNEFNLTEGYDHDGCAATDDVG